MELGFPALEHSGEGAGLIEAWSGVDYAIIIDATTSGMAPGTVQRFDAAEVAPPRGLFRYSSHLFGLAEAVETARVLGRLPRRLIIYGIEGGCFDFGEALSSAVAPAVEAVARRIIEEAGARVGSNTTLKALGYQ